MPKKIQGDEAKSSCPLSIPSPFSLVRSGVPTISKQTEGGVWFLWPAGWWDLAINGAKSSLATIIFFSRAGLEAVLRFKGHRVP